MGKREQSNHRAAGRFFSCAGKQRFEGALVGDTREQLIAVDQIEQRHRLAAQRVDDVPIVDDLRPLVVVR